MKSGIDPNFIMVLYYSRKHYSENLSLARKVSVNHGMGRDVSVFPEGETFGAFDRIAKNIKTVNSLVSTRVYVSEEYT